MNACFLGVENQLGNVKEARALATEITERGARLYELLGKEREARPQRLRAVAFLEASPAVEALTVIGINGAIL